MADRRKSQNFCSFPHYLTDELWSSVKEEPKEKSQHKLFQHAWRLGLRCPSEMTHCVIDNILRLAGPSDRARRASSFERYGEIGEQKKTWKKFKQTRIQAGDDQTYTDYIEVLPRDPRDLPAEYYLVAFQHALPEECRIPADDLWMAMGASKLRRPKEVAAVTDPKDAGQGDSLKLMEFAYRMGRDSLSSSSAAAPATSKPAEAAGPVFPPLQDGLVTAGVSSDAEPKTTPAAEVKHDAGQMVAVAGDETVEDLETAVIAEMERDVECDATSATAELEGEENAHDSVAKMKKALQLREDGKNKSHAEKKEPKKTTTLGAKPKAMPKGLKRPASFKIVKGKAKSKSAVKVSPKSQTTQAKKKPVKVAKQLKMTRACVYSRSYHQMKCKLLASGGLSEEMISKKAKAAGNAAVKKHFK